MVLELMMEQLSPFELWTLKVDRDLNRDLNQDQDLNLPRDLAKKMQIRLVDPSFAAEDFPLEMWI